MCVWCVNEFAFSLHSGGTMSSKSRIQYACAVLLILSSITLAFISDFVHGDIPNGTLMYIAQAFLLAGSIFGLEAYLQRVKSEISK